MSRDVLCHLWQVLVATCLLVGVPGYAWAAPTVALSGPTTAKGDGKTAIAMTLTVDPPTAAGTGNLELVASAGKVTRLRGAGEGKFEFEFLPPRIAEQTTVKIEARIVGGAKAQPLEVEVAPDVGEVSSRETGGPLDLRVPRRLVLGSDPSADVSIKPIEGLTLSLAVSVGTVTPLAKGDDGRLHATYTPPQEKYPQVVILVASSEDGALVDWTAIPLFGRPLVTAKSEPSANVRVRVADAEYGPLRADRQGRVRLRVLAPPGVPVAYAVARDAVGNERAVPLKLGVPEFRRTLGVCPPQSGRMLFFAVEPTGKPRPGVQLAAQTTLGRIESSKAVAPGYYEARVAFPDQAQLGEKLEVTVQVADEANSQATCETQVPGEAPTTLSVKLGHASYVAGAGKPIRVVVTLSYPGKRHPRRIPIRISADFGTVSKPRSVGTTKYEADWTMPDGFEGRDSAHLDVVTVGRPVLKDGTQLALTPGAIARIELDSGRSTLWADGQSSTTLTVHIRDAHGNGVPGVSLVATGSGKIGDFSSESPGEYTASYVAPISSGGTDTVVVQDASGKHQGSVDIRLVPGHRLRVSARIGYLTNLAKVSALFVAGGAAVRLPVLDDGLVAGVEAGYYASRKTQRDAENVEDVTVAASVVPLLVRLDYELPLQPLIPRLCLRAGVAWAHTEVESDSAGTTDAASWTWAIGGCAGAGIALGPGVAGLELGYLYAPIEESGLEGNVGGIDATVGYALGF